MTGQNVPAKEEGNLSVVGHQKVQIEANSNHAHTENHRREKDTSEPIVKIRAVAVVEPGRPKEVQDSQKLAKSINLKADNASQPAKTHKRIVSQG